VCLYIYIYIYIYIYKYIFVYSACALPPVNTSVMATPITEEMLSMSKVKLVELAKSCDIDVKSLTRDQLIEALHKFISAPTEESIVLGAETKFDPDEDLPPLITAEVFAEQDKREVISGPKFSEEWKYKLELEKMKMDFEYKIRADKMKLRHEREERQFKLEELKLRAALSTGANNTANFTLAFRVESAAKMLPKLMAEHEIETPGYV